MAMNLSTNQLFQMALQLSAEWKVVNSELTGDPKRLEIWLDFDMGTKFRDPDSGELCPVHDTVNQEWRHLNFWQYSTILHARVPRVRTPEGKVRLVEVPWARPESGFTLLFEAMVMLLARQMPIAEIARMVGEHDTRLWRMICHYVEQAHSKADWSKVRRIQVDETSSRRGYRYVTTILDAQTHELLFMAEGKGIESLRMFAEELEAHCATPAQIENVCMDMSPAFRAGAQRYFPQAVIVYDHYHIALLAGKAMDEVRKGLHREGLLPFGQLWALRGNEWNLKDELAQRRSELCRSYPKLGRAMMLKETLQDILAVDSPETLKWWCWRAKMSRLAPFRKLACSIQQHWEGVVAFMETGLTNAAIEAVNGIVQLAKRIARGFRSFRNFKAICYLKAANFDFNLPRPIPI